MKKNVFYLCFLLSTLFCFAQHHTSGVSKTATFMKSKNFKELRKNNKEIDSVGFFIDKGDTLIEVSGYELKGVRVAYEEKDSIFLQRYKQLVYNKQYQRKEDRLAPTMKIWKDKIKIYFDKSVDKYYKTILLILPNILTRKLIL